MSDSNRAVTARPTCFTLIEMLFVTSIIAMLASMLLPSFGRAIAAAKQVQCANHLKQIGIAANLYRKTYDAFPMPARFLDDMSVFNEYLETPAVFACPGNARTFGVPTAAAIRAGQTDYTYWPGGEFPDIELNADKGNNKGKGKNKDKDKDNAGHGNNLYGVDPDNPKFQRTCADKIKVPAVYDRCGPAHPGGINIVYLSDNHLETQSDMCNLWVLNTKGKLILDSSTPFPQ